ncbi:flagellar protein FliS [Paracoccaceae bacterium]|nr:flagellar protein FliS [Paracoccaceae bacterium]
MKKVPGKNTYQDNSTANPQIEDAHAAVTACLETLLHNLNILSEKPTIGSEVFEKVSNKCLTAIYILQSSLDFEKGASIAENLFKLYEYVKFQIIAIPKSYDEANLENAVMIISQISETWKALR